MALAGGSRFGSFEIVDIVGVGAMGEVYRARDHRLNRDVALKILPNDVAEDPERVARLTREARLLASLNHPNIATIYGIEEQDGRIALVLELVEGPTLADRLASGPLPVSEVLGMGCQIAEAMEAAHARGVIHRDLKPSNLKFSAHGEVKVLDFGIAKAVVDDSGAPPHPAASVLSTRSGVILGTTAYMSPEQMTGAPADRRSDIWAFGCVLFEALTGRRPFEGGTQSDTMVRILEREPDWSLLPRNTPPELERLIARCLRKDARKRFQDSGSVRVLLEELSTGSTADRAPSQSVQPARATKRSTLVLGAAVLVLASALAGWSVHAVRSRQEGTVVVSRTTVQLPADAHFSASLYPAACLAISPDGSRIVYCSGGASPRLYLRRLNDLSVEPIPGTEGGVQPFFSPDGKTLAFFTLDGSLKKLSSSGADPVTLLRGLPYSGFVIGTWVSNDRIVFDTWNGGLREVPADGGPIKTVSAPDSEWHQDPQSLPGSRTILYTAVNSSGHRVEARSLDGTTSRVVLSNASHARYLASGHLLFTRGGAIMVAPFDAQKLSVTGPAMAVPLPMVTVDDDLAAAPIPQLALSNNGTLVYVLDRSRNDRRRLLSVTRLGVASDVALLPTGLAGFVLSPDGDRLAIVTRDNPSVRLQVFDLRSQTLTPIGDYTQDFPGKAAWSSDGHNLFFAAFGTHRIEIFAHDLTRNTSPTRLWQQPGTYTSVCSASRDGRWLMYSIITDISRGLDLWLLDLGARGARDASKPFLATAANEANAAISPDGQWVAYVSDESGTFDIYVRRFPGGELKQRVAAGTGLTHPRWSADGHELLFLTDLGAHMLSVPVQLGATIVVGKARELFSGRFQFGGDAGQSSAVLPDGRFLLVERKDTSGKGAELVVVQNWFAEIAQLSGKQ